MGRGEPEESCVQPPSVSPLASLESLDNGILMEIFLRLPYPSSALFRCALASKRHLGLISAPSFLRQFRKLHGNATTPLLGCFINSPEPHFVPISHDQNPDLAAASRTVKFAPPPSSTPCVVIDSSDGLLLLLNEHEGLAVVDPLAPRRRQHVLPSPPPALASPPKDVQQRNLYFIASQAYLDGGGALLFHVLCFHMVVGSPVVAGVFSSDTGE